jgi:hypothetical protein
VGKGGWGGGDNCNPPEMCSSLPACQDNRETKTKQHIYKQKFFFTYSLGAKILPDLIMVPKRAYGRQMSASTEWPNTELQMKHFFCCDDFFKFLNFFSTTL